MSVFGRMARGETRYDFVGRRKRWYAISAVVVALCLASMIFKGFNLGIEFAGGTEIQTPAPAGTSLSDASDAVASTGVVVVSEQEIGVGYLLRTEELTQVEVQQAKTALADELGVDAAEISDASVSASWGDQATTKALQGLIAFLIAVCIYIAFRFEFRMAVAGIVALLHDLLISAGVYSLVGFEVTPATAIGLLTILGYSLYDTVVVFDKVDENVKGILGGSRWTYADRANDAVNQVLMRSINTSIIALLPVAGLLFVGAGLLGAGTLKDLALVLFVGIAAGTYSSIFIATPVLVDLKNRQPEYRALERRVAAKRASAGQSASQDTGDERVPVPAGARELEQGGAVEEELEPSGSVADGEPSAASGEGSTEGDQHPSRAATEPDSSRPEDSGGSPPAVSKPKPGVRPQRYGPDGKRR